jgi:hypothetical protein
MGGGLARLPNHRLLGQHQRRQGGEATEHSQTVARGNDRTQEHLRSIGRFSHRRPQPVTVIALRQLRGRERLVESIISVTRFATLYRSKAK